MVGTMPEATPNANFTSLGGSSVHESENPEYREYRRQWMENPKKFIVREFPIHLDIEITNRCNLKCTFCDKLPLLAPDQFGDMDFDLYKRIIDEGGEHGLCGVKLSYRGEPLLHKQAAEMVAYAKQKGVLDIYFNTNGMLLTEKKSHQLIDAGLDRISISVEGTDPEAFEKDRIGARFDVILRNIDRLMNIRASRNVNYPRIRVQTVALPWIDLEEYSRFWGEHADETAAIDYKDVVNRDEELIDPEWACPQLWQRMTIEYSGEIMPCNNDDYRLLSPGAAPHKTVRECWLHEKVQAARDLHQKGMSHKPEACNGCPWRTTQILKKRDEMQG